jgi:hypothetical protein
LKWYSKDVLFDIKPECFPVKRSFLWCLLPEFLGPRRLAVLGMSVGVERSNFVSVRSEQAAKQDGEAACA